MRPGLTGPWQVSGRNAVSYEERVKFDRDYAADAALLRDLSIILFTVVAVFRRTGR
jgi:lipopolysaccharide/colanic/teichoic acid biosynthesis glycosyltransferase